MRLRKVAGLLLAAAMAASLTAGCSGGNSTSTTQAPAESSGTSDSGAESTAAEGESAAQSGDAQSLGTPLADVRVRQALAYAIDLDAIVESLFDGKAEKAISFTSPGDWLNTDIPVYEYNPEKAKELLEHTRDSIQEICWKVGIQDSGYFSKLFKKYAGMTPLEYRKSKQ